MGGRYGKYGDAKRRQTLRKSRYAKHRLAGLRLRARVRRRKSPPRPPSGREKTGDICDRKSR